MGLDLITDQERLRTSTGEKHGQLRKVNAGEERVASKTVPALGPSLVIADVHMHAASL